MISVCAAIFVRPYKYENYQFLFVAMKWSLIWLSSAARLRLVARLLLGTLEHERVPERGIGWEERGSHLAAVCCVSFTCT